MAKEDAPLKSDDFRIPEHWDSIEVGDFLVAKHQRELELERKRTEREVTLAKMSVREERHETYRIIAGVIGVVIVLVALISAVYFGQTGNPGGPSTEQIEQEREMQCLERGGGYVPADLLDMAEQGICVFPGKTVEEAPDAK